jgi:hypothetical protein
MCVITKPTNVKNKGKPTMYMNILMKINVSKELQTINEVELQ